MSTGRVHAKIALVTGGGSGIGGATAILLANEGEITPTTSAIAAIRSDASVARRRDMNAPLEMPVQ